MKKWSRKKAQEWYEKQPWLVGSNYVTSSAVNQLEMWQKDTFDPKRIDEELGWAEKLGMNTKRVFLHNLLWEQDPEGFEKRLDLFLTIAKRHHIKPMLVLFDSCWNPEPRLGKQPDPRKGYHNSEWVQSPGAAILKDPSQYPRLEKYVKGVVGKFHDDDRILCWDIWNEVDNLNSKSYHRLGKEPENKVELALNLLPQAFRWAREAGAEQPLTACLWQSDCSGDMGMAPYERSCKGDWSCKEKLTPAETIALENSDIVTFHSYAGKDEFEQRIQWLKQFGRPVLCTEYMARGIDSTFENILPVAAKERVAAMNWGFVQGKSQTHLPWDSLDTPYVDREPGMWFHDLFHQSGAPYRQEEVDFVTKIIASVNKTLGKAAFWTETRSHRETGSEPTQSTTLMPGHFGDRHPQNGKSDHPTFSESFSSGGRMKIAAPVLAEGHGMSYTNSRHRAREQTTPLKSR